MGSSHRAEFSRQFCTSVKFRLLGALLFALALVCTATIGQAQTVTTIYNFADNGVSGATPWYVTLVQGTNGNLYGTTYNGGANLVGTAFTMSTSGSEKIIHNFAGGMTDGAYPTGGLTLGSDGNFYGTTQQGGSSAQGVVFQLTQTGTITILHNFNAFQDGAFPWGPPILASDGNLYGTTSGGGKSGNGAVYRISPSGNFNVIYNFDANLVRGFAPIAPPTQGTDGFLYIPVSEGGTSYCGTILKMSTAGAINSSYSFPCGAGGSFPIGPLVQDANGNFYSTTQDGGTNGEGTIYQVTSSLAVTVLHSFGATFGDGTFPGAGLLLATDGNYYGSTSDGGAYGDGILFNTNTSGTYNDLYSFNNSANLMQMSPLAPPVQSTNGILYGVTEFGGTSNDGTVYSLDMGLAPFVNSPIFSGRVGGSVLILGNHLKGTTSVTFNGMAASFKVLSDTHLSAVIPVGATSGQIRVTTTHGVLPGRKIFYIKK